MARIKNVRKEEGTELRGSGDGIQCGGDEGFAIVFSDDEGIAERVRR